MRENGPQTPVPVQPEPHRRGGVRRRAAAIAAAAAFLLAACSAGSGNGTGNGSGSGDGTGSPGADATVRIGLAAVPANLDFTTTGGAAIFQALAGNVYEGLVELDSDGQVQPLLATDWTVSEDGLRYTFTLREGITFHDGATFTAENVKFSLERLGEWSANTPGNLAAIESVEVASPTEATVVLSEPDAHLLYWLAGPLGAMFDPDSVSALATDANGTGPYTFGSYTNAVRMVLERNEEYWGEPAQVASVVLTYFADSSAAANALRTGGVDALFQAEAYDQIASLESSEDFVVTTGSTPGLVMMALNANRDALADPRVRQAIIHAIDKEAVLAAATSGYGTVLGGPTVPTDPFYVAEEPYPFDPEAARALLAEAGAEGLTLTFTVPNRPYAQTAAQVVQSDLAKVGVTARLEIQEFPAVWVERTMGLQDFDMSVVLHVEPRSLTNYGNPDYYWSHDNPNTRDAFGRARASLDDDAYVAAMREAVTSIVDDAASVWLYNPPNIVVTRAGVEGLPVNYTGVGIDLGNLSVAAAG
nr:ABC transporter substrate-binding protein [Actinomycetales bacterium]